MLTPEISLRAPARRRPGGHRATATSTGRSTASAVDGRACDAPARRPRRPRRPAVAVHAVAAPAGAPPPGDRRPVRPRDARPGRTAGGTSGWRGEEAPAMLAGVMAHAIRPMPSLAASAAGPRPRGARARSRLAACRSGGSQTIVDALADDVWCPRRRDRDRRRGDVARRGRPRPGGRVRRERPSAGRDRAATVCPPGTRARSERFRYGNAASKVDFALSEPGAVAERRGAPHRRPCTSAARATSGRAPSTTVARGATPGALRAGRPAGRRRRHPGARGARQRSGPTRTCRAAATSTRPRPSPERSSGSRPGSATRSSPRASRTAKDLENYDPNYIGGDIATGAPSVRQLIARPIVDLDPWRTPDKGIYLGSSSTPPGPSVHGLGGAYAARSALRHEFGITLAPHLGLDRGAPCVFATSLISRPRPKTSSTCWPTAGCSRAGSWAPRGSATVERLAGRRGEIHHSFGVWPRRDRRHDDRRSSGTPRHAPSSSREAGRSARRS